MAVGIDLEDEGPQWLFRGVPKESPEVTDVRSTGEIAPPRLDRRGPMWRRYHSAGDTETAYTSWTSDRTIAVDGAEYASSASGLSGRIVIFRLRHDSIDPARIHEGRADQIEYLIEGTIEGVEISDGQEGDQD